MRRIKYLVTLIIVNLVLLGCSTLKNRLPDNSPATLYASAHHKIQRGNFKGAISQLEILDNRYPFEPYSKQVQLDLINAYYKSGNLQSALIYSDRFMRFNPIHPNIDYVIYIRALSEIELDKNILHSFFSINRSDRDPEHAYAAFRNFVQLIQRFPNSQYVNDAKKYLTYIKDRLAKYELSVIDFYAKRGAYIAVINRTEQMLREYSDTKAIMKALPLMQNAYKQLQLNSEAEKVAKIIYDHQQ